MGREVRRVPKDWQHPKTREYNVLKHCYEERYHPMFDEPFAPKMREWFAEWDAWERGEKPADAISESYIDYNGPPPDPAYYRPDWPEETRTHLMMYENTSEGTPISPAFDTPEELARWLVDNNASAFGDMTASYESWLRIAKGGYAPSMVLTTHADGSGTMQSGVEALS